jgi:hypothetical protein
MNRGVYFCPTERNLFFEMCFHENKRDWMDFLLGLIINVILCFNVLLVNNIWTEEITKITDITHKKIPFRNMHTVIMTGFFLH